MWLDEQNHVLKGNVNKNDCCFEDCSEALLINFDQKYVQSFYTPCNMEVYIIII